ncbi:MAG: hypothetical protein ABL929_02750, partial [Ferruginibacter sp.]
MKKKLLILKLHSFLLLCFTFFAQNIFAQTVTYTSSGYWTCPIGVTAVTVQAWGAGGSGGPGSATRCGGGGGGGAYTTGTYTVVPGTTYGITVGVGDWGWPGANGVTGGQSDFAGANIALGGTGGGMATTINGAGGAGGVSAGGASDKKGGNGDVGPNNTTSGGGGGGAGTGGNGRNATGATAGALRNTGGGAGGAGVTVVSWGTAGNIYGGGGAGGRGATEGGGKGADGQVILTYTTSCVTPTAQPTGLVLKAISTTAINGTFTFSVSATNYLVVRTTTAAAPTNPSSGTSYAIGSTALGATTLVIDNDDNTTFTSTGLAAGTQYWYWVYAFQTGCGTNRYLTTSPLTGNVTTLTTGGTRKYWNGAGVAGGTAGTNFNTGANWIPTSAPTAGDDLIMNLDDVAAAYTVSLSANTTINSLTINGIGAITTFMPFILDINSRTFTTTANLTVINAASCTGTNVTRSYEITVSSTTGSILIGGDLLCKIASTTAYPNNAQNANSINIINGNIMTVTGNTLANSLNESSYSRIAFQAGNTAVTTFVGNCVLDDGTSAQRGQSAFSKWQGNTLTLQGVNNTDVCKFIMKGNLTLGETSSTVLFDAGTLSFEGTSPQVVTDKLKLYYFVPGNIAIGNSAGTINPTVTFTASTYGASPFAGYPFIKPINNLTIYGSSTMNIDAGQAIDNNKQNTNATTYQGTLAIPANGTLNCSGGDMGMNQTSNFPSNYANYNLSAASTVNFNGLISQEIPGFAENVNNYGFLTLSGSGIKYPSLIVSVASDMHRKAGATFNAVGGRIIFSGTTAQKFWAETGTSQTTFYDVTNNNTSAAGLSVDSSFNVKNEIKLTTGTKTTLNTGNITLLSTSSRTAHVADCAGTAPTIVYNSTYRFIVERYLAGYKAWRFLAAPILPFTLDATTPSVATAWRENVSALSSTGYGTSITGPSGPNAELDYYTQRGSMKYYNASSNTWVE